LPPPPTVQPMTTALYMTHIQKQIKTNLESIQSAFDQQWDGGSSSVKGPNNTVQEEEEVDDGKEAGFVIKWHFDKGYGFVRQEVSSGRHSAIFCHI